MNTLLSEVEQERRADPNKLPVETSMAGRNTVYHPCDHRGVRQHYGVCLHIIKAYEENRLKEGMEDCQRAIKHAACPALVMRQQERDVGFALFFRERQIPVAVVSDDDTPVTINVDKRSASYQRGFTQAARKTTAKVTKPATAPLSDFEKGMKSNQSASEAVNSAVAQSTSKPAIKTTTKPAAVDSVEERKRKAKEALKAITGSK